MADGAGVQQQSSDTGGGVKRFFRGLAEVLDPTGNLMADRLKRAQDSESQFRDQQAQVLWASIHSGNLTEEQTNEALRRIAKLYPGQMAKDAIKEYEQNRATFGPLMPPSMKGQAQGQAQAQPAQAQPAQAQAAADSSQIPMQVPTTQPPSLRLNLPKAADKFGPGTPTPLEPSPAPATEPAQPPSLRTAQPSMAGILHTAADPAYAAGRAATVAEAAHRAKMQETEATNDAKAQLQAAKDKATKDRLQGTLRQQLAKQYRVPTFDDEGNYVSDRPMTEEEVPPSERHKMKLQDAQVELAEATAAYRRAQAEAQNNPNSIAWQRLAETKRRNDIALENYYAINMGTTSAGTPLPGVIHTPEGAPVGTRLARFYGPTAQILSRSQAAPAVIHMAEQLKSFSLDPNNADLFGPASGRLAELERKFGTNDPRIGELRAKQIGLASLLVPLHGFRSQVAAESFVETIRQTYGPDAFAAALQGHIETALLLEDAAQEARTGKGGGTTTTPKPAPSGTQPPSTAKPKTAKDILDKHKIK